MEVLLFIIRLRRPIDIKWLHQRSHERQLLHTLYPQQPWKQHTGGSRWSSLVQPVGIFFFKMTDFYGQYLLACGWWRQSDDGPVRWDGPQRYGGRGKDEDPCQREEESSADGLDEEVRAVQQLLRRSLARTWTRPRELFAPRGGRVFAWETQ